MSIIESRFPPRLRTALAVVAVLIGLTACQSTGGLATTPGGSTSASTSQGGTTGAGNSDPATVLAELAACPSEQATRTGTDEKPPTHSGPPTSAKLLYQVRSVSPWGGVFAYDLGTWIYDDGTVLAHARNEGPERASSGDPSSSGPSSSAPATKRVIMTVQGMSVGKLTNCELTALKRAVELMGSARKLTSPNEVMDAGSTALKIYRDGQPAGEFDAYALGISEDSDDIADGDRDARLLLDAVDDHIREVRTLGIMPIDRVRIVREPPIGIRSSLEPVTWTGPDLTKLVPGTKLDTCVAVKGKQALEVAAATKSTRGAVNIVELAVSVAGMPVRFGIAVLAPAEPDCPERS